MIQIRVTDLEWLQENFVGWLFSNLTEFRPPHIEAWQKKIVSSFELGITLRVLTLFDIGSFG